MIINDIYVNKLHQEFIDNGIFPHPVFDLGRGKGEFIFGDNIDMDLVYQIIDTHEPTPFPQPPTLEEQLAEKDAQILKLKEEQFMMQQTTTENAKTQQELIELLMDMGVI